MQEHLCYEIGIPDPIVVPELLETVCLIRASGTTLSYECLKMIAPERSIMRVSRIVVGAILFLTGTESAFAQGQMPYCPCRNLQDLSLQKVDKVDSKGGRWRLWCKDGLRHGTETRWAPNGTRIFHGGFQDGHAMGLHRSWDETGQLLEKATYFADRSSITHRYSNGQLVSFYHDEGADKPGYQAGWNKAGQMTFEHGVRTDKTPSDVSKAVVEIISPEVIGKADNFVIAATNPEYFKANFTLDRARSGYAIDSREGREGTSFTLSYLYAAFEKLGVDERVVISFTNPGTDPWGFVANKRNGKILEPTVTKQKALETAKKHFQFLENEEPASMTIVPQGFVYRGTTNWSWAIRLNRKVEDGGTFVIHVDAVDGRFVTDDGRGG